MDYSEGSASGHSGGGGRGEPRPVSRRGYRDSAHSAMSRSGSMRPTSAYRGAASRQSTAGLGPAPPTAARQPAALTGFSMIDRPITQQGLSGVRTATARGFRTRQLQDRRYWEELLQAKVRDLRAEVARLHERAEAGERERSAKKHYEKRVRELAQELTDLQGRLADYNTAVRVVNGEATQHAVRQQTRELELENQRLQQDVERVFLEKRRKDEQLRQLNEQLEQEQSSISRLLAEMDPEQRDEYRELDEAAAAARVAARAAGAEVDRLARERDACVTEISGSQVKVHLLELNKRLAEAEEKRDALTRELETSLDPQEEREKLLLQVREDNAAIASMESNAANLKEQIKKVQEQIEQAEQDLKEGNSERHQKYRELKKREETMEAFLSTYEENLKKEHERIEQLERDIVFALEHSSSNIDLDLSEIDSLKQRGGYVADDSKKTVEDLTKDYEMLQANLKKAEATRERLQAELTMFPEKIQAMQDELVTLSDLEKLQDEGDEQLKACEGELSALRDKLEPTEARVAEAAKKLTKLQASLDGNEMYARLSGLEDRLNQLETRRDALREEAAAAAQLTDYAAVRTQTFEHVATLNKMIVEELNSGKNY